MMTLPRALGASLALLVSFSLAGCGGGTNGSASLGGLIGFQGATLRFLNGSPDAGAVDVAIGDPNNVMFTNVTYGTVSPYAQYFQQNSPDVFVYAHNTRNVIAGHTQSDGNVATTNITLGPKTRDTIVLVGYAATSSVAAVKFQEHIFNTSQSFGAVQFHHAAQGASGTVFDTGYYPIGNPAARVSIGSVSYGQAPVAMEPLPNPPTGTGIGFYLGPTQTIAPSQVDATDGSNVMPIAGAAQFNDQNISVYAIDAAGIPNYRLFAVFDPDN